MIYLCVAAEEYQKFGYPASEFVLEGLLSPEHGEVWAPLPRIVEFVFNCGQNGWTVEMIETFQKLCWRYCILIEETYDVSECLMTLHSLIHLPEDIARFSSPDNFWCFQFERAVGRYVKQSSNNKGIEKTFARKESQREFIKAWSHQNKQLKIASSKTGRYDQQKVGISIIFFPLVQIYVMELFSSTPNATMYMYYQPYFQNS